MLIPENKNKICIFCDAQDSYYIDTFKEDNWEIAE